MGGDSEYEPKDSRNITGTARTRDGHFTGDPQRGGHGGIYEPRDSRNVTGTASTPDGRWSNDGAASPEGVPSESPADVSEASDQSGASGGRDDALGKELDRERLEPGLNTDGKGDVGANPSRANRGDQNSNT